MPFCYKLCLPKIHMVNLIPKVTVLGGGLLEVSKP